MTIAITGATGFVGQALLDVAAASGLDVRALAR
ncbi:MAG: NAD-dependent epimerase/dehydratase family protein, partial [Novosphingobium sp.]